MKFSIVTPVYNGQKYIAETIDSVLSQKGNFEIEYIIVDGGSADNTMDIVKSYSQRLEKNNYPIHCNKISFRYISENDNGMHDAIQKGFKKTSGDVMAYINADDKYLAGAFDVVSSIFVKFPEIEWLKGINATSNENGEITSKGSCHIYQKDWIGKGIYGRYAYFIQQDSVFWKRTLWEKAQVHISSFRYAGDFALWVSFAAHAALWSFNSTVSIFRKRQGQLSENMQRYRHEQEKIAPHYYFFEKRVLLFFFLIKKLRLETRPIFTKILESILFPFSKQWCYIDFDPNNTPIKKQSSSYLI